MVATQSLVLSGFRQYESDILGRADPEWFTNEGAVAYPASPLQSER